jgi:hypothetical protein
MRYAKGADLFDQEMVKMARMLKSMGTIEAPAALSSALNRVAAEVRTEVTRKVSSETKIQPKVIRKRFYIRRSSVRSLRATFVAYRSDIPAISMGVALTKTRRHKGRVVRGRGVKVGNRTYPGAFINRVSSNNTFQVLRRKSDSRYPIEVVKERVRPVIDRYVGITVSVKMRHRLPVILKRELQYRMSKYAK